MPGMYSGVMAAGCVLDRNLFIDLGLLHLKTKIENKETEIELDIAHEDEHGDGNMKDFVY